MDANAPSLDELAMEQFAREGFLVLPRLGALKTVAALRACACSALDPVIGPAEFEADVDYPGAPVSRDVPGGGTPRRLLSALARDAVFRDWATGCQVAGPVQALLGGEALVVQGHHNCVMTKFPGYSSETLWHQDIRYWSFEQPTLVSVWLALGDEKQANGALRMIPGSHRLELGRERLDAELFLRTDHPDNSALIATAVTVELEAGDAVCFDARTLHAAGRNDTEEIKLSLVFTYHRSDNKPLPGTRSAGYPSLPLLTG